MSVSCTTGSSLARPRITRRMASGSYGEGPYGEDVTWLQGYPKWGFLIYRCDYGDDEAWKTFIDGWLDRVKSYLLDQYGDTSLVKTLDCSVKEDKLSLDNASVEQVHKIFTEWTRSQEAQAEQTDATKTGRVSFARYTPCIHVAAQSLNGCLNYISLPQEEADQFLLNVRDPALGEAAYVNIVRVEKEWYFPSKLTGDWDRQVEEEEIEEDCEEDRSVISVKMHLPYVLPAVYTRLAACDDLDRWDSFTRDPHGICVL